MKKPQPSKPAAPTPVSVPREVIEKAYALACTAWSDAPSLSLPLQLPAGTDSVAFINLGSRQIHFNPGLLVQHGVLDTLPALLAHEIGHHLEYPHTLRLSAELDLIALELFEKFPPHFLNLFYDLLINEVVGRNPEFQSQLSRLYRAVSPKEPSALFEFYLTIYETLWSREGEIVPKEVTPALREKANLFSQTFFSLSSIYEQFTYFCSVFAPFIIEANQNPAQPQDLFGDLDAPGSEDYPDSMEPSRAGQEAIEKAIDAGWFPKGDYEGRARTKNDPLDRIARISSRPGQSSGKLREALVDRVYQRLIEKTLAEIDLPPLPTVLDPFLPAGLEDWEQGDEFSKIDWIGSINQRGILAALAPLQREWLADDEPGELPGIPRLELYLDTSGSMPDPSYGLNAMTLAAQVLATLAIRRGSQVRAIIYSAGPLHTSPWLRSEHAARRFLFQHLGGGTDFPFAEAAESAREFRDVLRVVISDSDFVWNLSNLVSSPPGRTKATESGFPLFQEGIEKSRLFTLLLNQVELKQIERALGRPRPRKLHVVTVPGSQHFAQLAARLADSLFPREARSAETPK